MGEGVKIKRGFFFLPAQYWGLIKLVLSIAKRKKITEIVNDFIFQAHSSRGRERGEAMPERNESRPCNVLCNSVSPRGTSGATWSLQNCSCLFLHWTVMGLNRHSVQQLTHSEKELDCKPGSPNSNRIEGKGRTRAMGLRETQEI